MVDGVRLSDSFCSSNGHSIFSSGCLFSWWTLWNIWNRLELALKSDPYFFYHLRICLFASPVSFLVFQPLKRNWRKWEWGERLKLKKYRYPDSCVGVCYLLCFVTDILMIFFCSLLWFPNRKKSNGKEREKTCIRPYFAIYIWHFVSSSNKKPDQLMFCNVPKMILFLHWNLLEFVRSKIHFFTTWWDLMDQISIIILSNICLSSSLPPFQHFHPIYGSFLVFIQRINCCFLFNKFSTHVGSIFFTKYSIKLN